MNWKMTSSPWAHRFALVSALTAALLAGLAQPAFAQATFTTWDLNLWPEYDDPRLLVIFNPQLDPSIQLPYTLNYPIPVDGQMGMACQLLPSGEHDCQPQKSSVTGDIKNISFSAPTERELYMEYYMDPLSGERPDKREFTYTFTPPEDIQTLSVQVRQPADAEDFVLEPAPQQTVTDAEGASYLSYVFNDVKAGQPIDFAFSYTRPSWIPPKQANGAAPTDASAAAGAGGDSNLLLWAVVGLLGVIAVMMYRNQKQPRRR